MRRTNGFERLNIYLDSPDLREKIRIAAAHEGVTPSRYCLKAIRHRLAKEGYLPAREAGRSPRAASDGLDRLRCRVGPIGVSVSELVAEGRRR